MSSLLLTSISFSLPTGNTTTLKQLYFPPLTIFTSLVLKANHPLSSVRISVLFLDMIDHHILLSRFHSSLGITGSTFKFIQSYISGGTQYVRVYQASSSRTSCNMDVPQGCVLGPILSSLYTSQMGNIVSNLNTSLQQYANDTQPLSTPFKPVSPIYNFVSWWWWIPLRATHRSGWWATTLPPISPTMVLYLTVISLKQLLSANCRQKLRTYLFPPGIAGIIVPLSDNMKTLGVTLDSHLTLNSHIWTVCKSAFYHTWALRYIQYSLTDDMLHPRSFSLALTMPTHSSVVSLNKTSVNYS